MKKPNHFGLSFLLVLWLWLALWAWVRPADDASLTERRQLAQRPEASVQSVLDGSFMDDFRDYVLDQFPLRQTFRSLKALTSHYVFFQSDNNGIYIADGSAAQMLYPLDAASVDYAAARFQDLYDLYLQDVASIRFAIIPDKGYYLAEPSGHLSMDYDALFETLESSLPWAEFVDLTDCLTADSYYRTDTHWRQETLLSVAQRLGASSVNFTAETPDQPFYGVYFGQAALPLEPDTLTYLTWEGWEACTVWSVDTGEVSPLYDLAKADSRDPYDLFLSGPMALQIIENPHAETDRELIVFRDSFASSLTPLLVPSYARITLIDTRYLSPSAIGDYVNFEGKDILFLYSTLLLNSSGSFRK